MTTVGYSISSRYPHSRQHSLSQPSSTPSLFFSRAEASLQSTYHVQDPDRQGFQEFHKRIRAFQVSNVPFTAIETKRRFRVARTVVERSSGVMSNSPMHTVGCMNWTVTVGQNHFPGSSVPSISITTDGKLLTSRKDMNDPCPKLWKASSNCTHQRHLRRSV